MTKQVQKPTSLLPEKPAVVSLRSAVLSALSLLSASMALSVNDVATADDQTKTKTIQNDVTTRKAKTADPNQKMIDQIIQGQVKPGGSTGQTVPPKPTSGSHK
jgi:hypothetical protein